MIFSHFSNLCAFAALNIVTSNVLGQELKTKGDSIPSKKFYNWHNLDPKKDKIQGISTDQVYNGLLKSKPMTRVVVAVIDGGVDIHHEDLKGKIWVNEDEVPGNKLDDDHNGYIDDVYGWNFIGGTDGKNIQQETAEVTRLYKKYKEKFKGKDTTGLSGTDSVEYTKYETVKNKYFEKLIKAQEDYAIAQSYEKAYRYSDSVVSQILHKTKYTLKDIRSINTEGNEQLRLIKKFFKALIKNGLDGREYIEYKDYLSTEINYHFNPEFNPRSIVGDNPEVWNDTVYGNNDVAGNDPVHGTFVAGVIAADRNNIIGIKGITDSVKIMVIRTVPDGDERDKDVANAIIYAVDNGAQILNLSFGKDFSPQKRFVDKALKLAQLKGVLIVHAAGNDAENIDVNPNFPNKYDSTGMTIMENWIEVGASSQKLNKELPAKFSNYGKNVDLFAPGANICSTAPGNKYGVHDGTSFAAPMVTGAAALLKSVYPSLSSSQMKEILLKSCLRYPTLNVYLPEKESKNKVMISFGSLSATGGVINLNAALQMAEQYVGSQTSK